mgnify:CR=1 FL=1
MLKVLKIDDVKVGLDHLRDVDPNSEAYLGIVEVIRTQGSLGAIVVRNVKDPRTGAPGYELVDGLHRLTASRQLGMTEVNADVQDMDDNQVAITQITMNLHRVETKPSEFTKQLQRYINSNPMMSRTQLAVKLGKPPSWINQRLSLSAIENPEIQANIDEGVITLSNAFNLAKLPPADQLEFMAAAMTMSPQEFTPKVAARAKEIREQTSKGRTQAPAGFVPVPFLKKMSELKSELEDSKVGKDLIIRFSAETAREGWDLAMSWVLNLDPVSVEQKKAEWQQHQDEKEAANKRRADERKAKAAQQAAEATARAHEQENQG